MPLKRQTRPPPVVAETLRPYHAWVGDDHALALLRIFLPLQLLPLQHVCNLLLRDQGLAATQQVEKHLMHRQHLLPTIYQNVKRHKHKPEVNVCMYGKMYRKITTMHVHQGLVVN